MSCAPDQRVSPAPHTRMVTILCSSATLGVCGAAAKRSLFSPTGLEADAARAGRGGTAWDTGGGAGEGMVWDRDSKSWVSRGICMDHHGAVSTGTRS